MRPRRRRAQEEAGGERCPPRSPPQTRGGRAARGDVSGREKAEGALPGRAAAADAADAPRACWRRRDAQGPITAPSRAAPRQKKAGGSVAGPSSRRQAPTTRKAAIIAVASRRRRSVAGERGGEVSCLAVTATPRGGRGRQPHSRLRPSSRRALPRVSCPSPFRRLVAGHPTLTYLFLLKFVVVVFVEKEKIKSGAQLLAFWRRR